MKQSKKMKFLFAYLISFVFLIFIFQNLTVTPNVEQLPVLKVYISAQGSDSDDGLSAGSAVRTLTKAHSLVKNFLSQKGQQAKIEIYIDSGTYYGQGLTWTAVPKKGSLNFIGSKDRPLFDGRISDTQAESSSAIFISFRPGFSGETNIHVSNLMVQNYLEGINFLAPSRDDSNMGISNNSVTNVHFSSIGNIEYHDKQKLGLAVIRLVNTKNSIFKGNDFININNVQGGGAQHAFYVAHFSSNNIFEGNQFINNMSGHTIKIRDFSNDNLIKSNFFQNVSPTALQVWHCERSARRDCTKAHPGEARSYNNTEG